MLVVVGPDVEQVGGILLQARFGYWRMVENRKGLGRRLFYGRHGLGV